MRVTHLLKMIEQQIPLQVLKEIGDPYPDLVSTNLDIIQLYTVTAAASSSTITGSRSPTTPGISPASNHDNSFNKNNIKFLYTAASSWLPIYLSFLTFGYLIDWFKAIIYN